MEILFFGQLADISGSSSVQLSGISDLAELQKTLHQLYPGLAEKKYRIAVGNKITEGNTPLQDADKIALLPPFSGG
jgi:molybdopterin synthase sulfur carrier subunit